MVKSEPSRKVEMGAGKDGGKAAGRVLEDGVVADVPDIEIPGSVKGEAVWLAQAGDGDGDDHPAGCDADDRIVAAVRHIEIARGGAGEARANDERQHADQRESEFGR